MDRQPIVTALDQPVGRLMSPAVAAAAEEPVGRVIGRVTAEGGSAAVIVAGGRITGIVTDADIRSRAAGSGEATSTIGGLATRPVETVSAGTVVADAIRLMTEHGIKHLPVVDTDDRPIGMVTAAALLTALAGDPLGALVEAGRAADVTELGKVYQDLPARVGRLVGTGAGGLVVIRLVSLFSEAALGRAAGWTVNEIGPAPARYAVVALGSLARREQTLVTDQDHALVIEDGAGDHPWFADFGQGVTDILAAVGFPRCPGDIMIANAEWRGERSAWQRRWDHYLRSPDPRDVLSTNIVLDARTVHGDDELVEPFFSVADRAATEGGLLPFLANSARRFRPPTGLFGRWKLEADDRGQPGRAPSFDIKKGAIAPIVHIARVHGVAARSRSMETVGRLRDAAAAGLLSTDSADILINGYELATTIRLIEQSNQAERGRPLDNWVAPSDLSAWQRAGLREVFKTIKRAQDAIGQAYPVGQVR